MKIGDRVEAGWLAGADNYAGPLGTVTAIEGGYFRIIWDNGFGGWFPRVELRLQKASRSRPEAPAMSEEALAAIRQRGRFVR